MQWRRHAAGSVFSVLFVVSCFTNKFVLSVLNFTYPTLFQGWQTFVGAALLLLAGRLGWVEMSRISRSAALSWLPGSFLFVGNIYAGSRALSHMDIPFFFTLQNSSHAVTHIVSGVVHRGASPCAVTRPPPMVLSGQQKARWMKPISISIMLLSAVSLPLQDPQFDASGYLWAVCHLFCIGAYRVFQGHCKSPNLSDLEQQCINYLFSVLLLALAAHPTGDLTAVLEFPSLWSYTFHCGCCASALLGFLLLLASVKLRAGLSLQHVAVWMFLSKVVAMSLAPLIFSMDMNPQSLMCVVLSHVGEALLLLSERDPTVT